MQLGAGFANNVVTQSALRRWATRAAGRVGNGRASTSGWAAEI